MGCLTDCTLRWAFFFLLQTVNQHKPDEKQLRVKLRRSRVRIAITKALTSAHCNVVKCNTRALGEIKHITVFQLIMVFLPNYYHIIIIPIPEFLLPIEMQSSISAVFSSAALFATKDLSGPAVLLCQTYSQCDRNHPRCQTVLKQ